MNLASMSDGVPQNGISHILLVIILICPPPAPTEGRSIGGVIRCDGIVLREISMQPEELGLFPGSSELCPPASRYSCCPVRPRAEEKVHRARAHSW